MKTVLFATSNRGKAKEVKRIMKKLNVKIIPLDLHEDKTLSHEQLVVRKAWDAFEKTGKPVVVEDTGLFVEGFKGYPGLNSKFGRFLKEMRRKESFFPDDCGLLRR